MDLLQLVNLKLAILTLAGQVFVILSVAWLLFSRFQISYPFAVFAQKFFQFFGQNGLVFAFISSLGATALSLFYSQVIGFPPCELCWWQRIFMYPLPFLFAMALVKKDFKIADYALLLASAGFLISLYHNYIYYHEESLNALCQFLGAGASCLQRYVFEFNYITIPLMSLTAFALIITLLFLQKEYLKKLYGNFKR